MNTTGDMELDAFAARLKAACEPQAAVSTGFADGVMARVRKAKRAEKFRQTAFRAGVAGAFAIAAGLAWHGTGTPSFAAKTPFQMAVSGDIDGILRTQGEDGGWKLARLAQCNTAALERVAAGQDAPPEVRRAYRRALRWMRLNGVTPLTPAEFERMEEAAKTWMKGGSIV